MDKIVLLLALLLIVIVFFTACISAILTCFLKDRKRLYAIDTLLTAATLLILTTLGLTLLPSVKEKASHVKVSKAIKLADAAVDDISEAGYADELTGPIHTIINWLAAGTNGNELQKADENVKKLAAQLPKSPAIVSRLAIILHAENKDTKPLFADFDEDEEGTSDLIDVLETLYGKPGATTNSEQSARVQPDAKSMEAIIRKNLPSGWYQKTALMDLYKKFDPVALKSALHAEHQNSESWKFRIQSYLLADIIVFILGMASIVKFFTSKREIASEFIPMTNKFRRMYAILISTIFTQVLVGGLFGFYLGISSVVTHKPADYSDYEATMSPILMLSGASSCLLLFYMLILKQQSLTLKEAFTRSALKLKTAQIVSLCLGGFCAGTLLIFIARFIFQFFPNAGRSTNTAYLEMINAFEAGNILMILKSSLFACLIAPFTEELMFRGLLFGWLRARFGALPAIIVSSALFALWHFDPNGFVQYFSLGVVLATVYNRTRNLWISIIIHGLYNFWVTSTVFWLTSYQR